MMALLSRTQMILAALCALLAALFVYELNAAPAAVELPAVRWQPSAATEPLALAPPLPPSESFAAIDARPLFNPARRPIEVPDPKAAAAAAPPPPSNAVLMGVIIDGERRIALIRTPDSPLALSATVGANVSGWQVAAIEPDHVVLHSGTTEFILNLNAKRPADGGAMPGGAPLPPRPPQIPPANVHP